MTDKDNKNKNEPALYFKLEEPYRTIFENRAKEEANGNKTQLLRTMLIQEKKLKQVGKLNGKPVYVIEEK